MAVFPPEADVSETVSPSSKSEHARVVGPVGNLSRVADPVAGAASGARPEDGPSSLTQAAAQQENVPRSTEQGGAGLGGEEALRQPETGVGVLTARCESFRSLTSYGSFRSCNTYKSFGGTSSRSRTSFKSAISRWTNKEGVDNQVFYECSDHGDTVSYKSCQEGKVQDISANREIPVTEPKKRLLSAYGMYLGYLFSILAGITFTASNVLVKLVPRLDPWVLLLFRAGLQLVLMIPLLAYFSANPLGPRPHRVKIFLQGLIGGLLPVAIYFAVRRLPLGDAATIFFSAPVFTLILSSIILRERCGLYRIITITLMVAGILLLCRPTLLFSPAMYGRTEDPLTNASYSSPIEPSEVLSLAAVEAGGTSSVEASEASAPTSVEADGASPLSIGEGREASSVTPVHGADMPSSYYTSFHQLLQHNLLGWPIGVNFSQVNKSALPEILQKPDHLPGVGDVRGGRDPVGLAAALAVPILTACLALLTRQSRDVHWFVLVFWFGAGALIVAIIGLCTLGNLQISYGTQEWVLTTLIALLGIAGNILMIKALSWLKPGKVMILRSSEIIAAYILQISVFKTVPVWLDLGGAVMVLGSVLLMGVEHFVVKRIQWRFF